MFDHEGSGREQTGVQQLQEILAAEFRRTHWEDHARAIVLSPELENWIWTDSPHVDAVIGWKHSEPSLRPWLIGQGL